MNFKHVSVLLEQSIEALCIKDGGIYVDGTLGGGGHSYQILSRADCRLVGIDQDRQAIEAAKTRLAPFQERVCFVNQNFSNITSILKELAIDKIDGALFDLGVSSYQLDNAQRGFSYMQDAPLDMRMNQHGTKTAYDVVNSYTKEELTHIFYEYGEEKWSARIAQFIVEARKTAPVQTTGQLVELIKAAIPKKARQEGGHPAKRVFQAIRIEVNGELEIIHNTIEETVSHLKSGGRLAIITFHSLEDRLVKQTFADLARGCSCPKEFPVCVCGKEPVIRVVSRKPVLPSEEECAQNPRAKSAKLRVAEKL